MAPQAVRVYFTMLFARAGGPCYGSWNPTKRASTGHRGSCCLSWGVDWNSRQTPNFTLAILQLPMDASPSDKKTDCKKALPRSPERMCPTDTGLLVVDVQERLIPVEPYGEQIVWNCRRLLDGAEIFGVRRFATEQYPEKLGPTVAALAERLDTPAASKMSFSCGECGEVLSEWRESGVHRVLVCGIETHVCVQQTVLDLLAAGFQVLVAVDAVGARFTIDHKTALRRMEASGALLTTTESALFEWCGRSGTAEFKQISALVKEKSPAVEA